MSKDRLIRLKSYAALPEDLRNAVKLHLLHGVPGPEAVECVGRPNSTRDWNQTRVQTVLREYGEPDSAEDWVARLDAIQGTDEDSQPKPSTAGTPHS